MDSTIVKKLKDSIIVGRVSFAQSSNLGVQSMNKKDCPLCGSESDCPSTTGDWNKYICPNCGEYDITRTEEVVGRSNLELAGSHRQRISRERSRGIKVPRVGVFPKFSL